MSADYTNTLNLPKTAFSMRANLPAREPEMLRRDDEADLYHKLLEKNRDNPMFILHDGPPFSNNGIHMGTAMNKILKDFIIKYKAMTGYCAPYVPGWDNHGMPIESAIIKKNKLDRKKMTIPEFRRACEAFARHFVDVQMEEFRRLGVVGDWAHPYLTMSPEMEAREVKVFGKMYGAGYIYKGLKPVYWCPKDETALAEAEIEYQDDPCTSIYVKFRLTDDKGRLPGISPEDTYFVIWTTTTWTLPGNVAIAVHPRESYVVARASDGKNYIVAEALLEKTMKAGGLEAKEILATLSGKELEFMEAAHPFLDRKSVLLNAEYVTMDSGTGCVHTAPGFGADDYRTCMAYGIDIIVPVDDRGYQTADAGKYAGLYYAESGEAILADLKESGALFASEELTHSYPHCWRCKSPVIFRATPQWFCSVAAFRDAATDACRKVDWLPAWGEERMIQMVRERADWCISRQRHWGLPIPVFYCEDCGKPVCTGETIDRVSAIFAEEGSNAWFEREAAALLPDGFVCPHCGGKRFTKETDTLDGWFDSGSTHFSVLEREHHRFPADLYLEGGRRREADAQVPRQLRIALRADPQIRRRSRPSLGRLQRLPGGRPRQRRDLRSALRDLPQDPQHRAHPARKPRGRRQRLRSRAGSGRRCGYAPARPLDPRKDQPPRPHLPRGVRPLRVPYRLPRDQRLLHRGAFQAVYRHHQGPPLLQRQDLARAPQRADRDVPGPQRDHAAPRADPRLYLQ